MRYLLLRLKRFCGFITGLVFFLSGLVKLMDPVGAGLVMKEYYAFLHLGFLSFSAKTMGVAFALFETIVGVALITGVWRKITAQAALIMQGFFTLLTLLLVIFDPEMDCGCFGEAIHLTHWQTFLKNIVLMALLSAYYFPSRHIGTTKKKKYISFALVTVSVMAFTAYSLRYIPLIDFTAYKPGAELQAGARINADEMYESVFTYEKDGVQEEFTLGHLPDSTWTFVSVDTRLKEGQKESTTELSFYDPVTEQYMDTLATEGKVMVVSVYAPKDKARLWKMTERFTTRAEAAGFNVLLLCTDVSNVPQNLLEKAYISDYKTLISLNRSNGGVTYFYNGMLIRKWAARNAADVTELNDIADSDATEIYIDTESKGSLVFQGFLLYVFAVMLLL
jgi:uncharacterized membrane protein YphA (DoxX/SURF4 family)